MIRKFVQKNLLDVPSKNNTDTVIGQYVSSKNIWLLLTVFGC